MHQKEPPFGNKHIMNQVIKSQPLLSTNFGRVPLVQLMLMLQTNEKDEHCGFQSIWYIHFLTWHVGHFKSRPSLFIINPIHHLFFIHYLTKKLLNTYYARNRYTYYCVPRYSSNNNVRTVTIPSMDSACLLCAGHCSPIYLSSFNPCTNLLG